MNPTTCRLDRADLDRGAVRREIARGLAGADDDELFLETAGPKRTALTMTC